MPVREAVEGEDGRVAHLPQGHERIGDVAVNPGGLLEGAAGLHEATTAEQPGGRHRDMRLAQSLSKIVTLERAGQLPAKRIGQRSGLVGSDQIGEGVELRGVYEGRLHRHLKSWDRCGDPEIIPCHCSPMSPLYRTAVARKRVRSTLRGPAVGAPILDLLPW